MMANKKGNVEVIQVNLNKCFQAQLWLTNTVKKKKRFLVGIQEPYCYKGRAMSLGRNITQIADTDDPRAMLLGSCNLGIQAVTHLCTRDTAVALMKLGGY
jgi:hypothetical protein